MQRRDMFKLPLLVAGSAAASLLVPTARAAEKCVDRWHPPAIRS
jgi:hypothetical protein